MPPPPPDLADDAISEILLRLPPDEPQWLFRAALVCKPWLRILTDPGFLRRYRDFHGAPPLLGITDIKPANKGIGALSFVLTTAAPAAFPTLESFDAPYVCPLDCRHGRVLFLLRRGNQGCYHICDPVTGDRHIVPQPDTGTWFVSSVMFCAAAGCDHADCHGGPFCLIQIATDCTNPIPTLLVAMYSSETGAWRAPARLDGVHSAAYTGAYNRGPLIGDEIYFALLDPATIFKYDWANNVLSVVNPQPPLMHEDDDFALMVMEDGSLGLASIEDSRLLHLWSRRVSPEEPAEWVQCRVIDLEEKMPMANLSDFKYVVGFAEGVGVIFISTRVGFFMFELKSGRARKVDTPWDYSSVLPYMSFYTPDRLLGRPADL